MKKLKKNKTKKDMCLIKIQRGYQVEAGFFDGRFVVKIEETKKNKSSKKRVKKHEILKDLDK